MVNAGKKANDGWASAALAGGPAATTTASRQMSPGLSTSTSSPAASPAFHR
jgi:hypothetical protein